MKFIPAEIIKISETIIQCITLKPPINVFLPFASPLLRLPRAPLDRRFRWPLRGASTLAFDLQCPRVELHRFQAAGRQLHDRHAFAPIHGHDQAGFVLDLDIVQ